MIKRLIIIIALVIGIAAGGLFVYRYFWSPQFFPLNNPNGSYRITRGCPATQGWQETDASGLAYQGGFCVEYKGDGVFNPMRANSNFYRITIGRARMELGPLLNRNVIIKSGKFTTVSRQCVNNSCASIGGPVTVLDITSLEVK